MPTMLEQVKLALRISSTKQDADFERMIRDARAELIRSGVSASKAALDDDDLITDAIIRYCAYSNANIKDKDGYFTAWQYKVDCLRKSTGYTE